MSWYKLVSKTVSPIKWVADRKNISRLLGARVQVVVCVITREPDSSILLAKSIYHDRWMPPQEGVNLKDSFKDAVDRCLSQEFGLDSKIRKELLSNNIKSIRYIATIPLIKDRRNERLVADDAIGTWMEHISMTKKAYWKCTIIIDKQDSIKPVPNMTEVLDFKWYALAEARKVIQSSNLPDKANLLLTIFDKCHNDIHGA
ncbi:NUDIX domain-containing protein [Methylophilus medardicus]|uniref:Nudix hydrolase domain-containing protein n=1 Tax=Methylophilus medardicus TaxID=2588534 RepID=A0A5B8CUL5_9PROT|nr:NUDIX domain-containing protein [Methylophilus medardicus]QDC44585.1 hypothetical protein FIU01_08615 [Methylophilus medardicus]QDC49592.1 hypothetical protein FIU00_08615 [Methylophilus medardicus]QDC53297.1 hypothetical protein FIT99_08615 [Methylophilus medardicus]